MYEYCTDTGNGKVVITKVATQRHKAPGREGERDTLCRLHRGRVNISSRYLQSQPDQSLFNTSMCLIYSILTITPRTPTQQFIRGAKEEVIYPSPNQSIGYHIAHYSPTAHQRNNIHLFPPLHPYSLRPPSQTRSTLNQKCLNLRQKTALYLSYLPPQTPFLLANTTSKSFTATSPGRSQASLIMSLTKRETKPHCIPSDHTQALLKLFILHLPSTTSLQILPTQPAQSTASE